MLTRRRVTTERPYDRKGAGIGASAECLRSRTTKRIKACAPAERRSVHWWRPVGEAAPFGADLPVPSSATRSGRVHAGRYQRSATFAANLECPLARRAECQPPRPERDDGAPQRTGTVTARGHRRHLQQAAPRRRGVATRGRPPASPRPRSPVRCASDAPRSTATTPGADSADPRNRSDVSREALEEPSDVSRAAA